MSRPEFAHQPQFSGSFGSVAGLNRGSMGVQDGQDGRPSLSGQGTYIAANVLDNQLQLLQWKVWHSQTVYSAARRLLIMFFLAQRCARGLERS